MIESSRMAAALMCLMIAVSPSFAEPTTTTTKGKKLIQYGWDAPDTTYLRKHIKRMEASSPFDGVVVTARATPGEGKLGGTDALGWTAFQRTRFKPADYEHAIADLKATKTEKFTDNFLALISQPDANFDWLDDAAWGDALHNIGVMARIAKQSGCVGLMFDPEEYVGPMWSYGRMPETVRTKHTYDAYATKMRQRGEEFIKAINAEFPDVTLLCLFGPSMHFKYLREIGRERIAESHYNLLGPFYDGVIRGASERTALVDGYEYSYGYYAEDQFVGARKEILNDVKADSLSPERFEKHVRAGFGLWLDNQSNAKGGWFPDEPAKNHFTPQQWQAAVHFALKHSDQYVWIYNERANWWNGEPGKTYVDAITAARTAPAPTK